MVFAYVMVRFRWKFAAGAIGALVHDVIITFGFFSVTGLEFDQNVLAAILAVIGYSLNDTIVVYDRIRENFRAMRRGTAEAIINASINQTMSRTIITGLTTLLVLIALFFLGGESVGGFSVALIVGIIVGTYSSIYVASAAALFLDVSPADLMPPKREEIDDMP
jgi:preprotein translocase subunit SecF